MASVLDISLLAAPNPGRAIHPRQTEHQALALQVVELSRLISQNHIALYLLLCSAGACPAEVELNRLFSSLLTLEILTPLRKPLRSSQRRQSKKSKLSSTSAGTRITRNTPRLTIDMCPGGNAGRLVCLVYLGQH